MTVYFCNEEPIDLNAIAIMGVSVKLNESAIGYFGTGLKFAIATLLRTGHKVNLIRSGKLIEFSAICENIRDHDFQRITMGDDRLGFTTQLGRNWEPWQAYRELRCNCTDEGGIISESVPDGEWGTIFQVDGEPITKCHRNRREIFLESSPLTATHECEIHEGNSLNAFYRGVKSHEHERYSIFTYNIVEKINLTEDRTIASAWEVGYYAARAIALSNNEDVIERALMADKGTFENNLSYSSVNNKPSPEFMKIAHRLRHNMHINRDAIKLWERYADIRLTYAEAITDAFEEQQIEQAISLVSRLGIEINRQDFMIVEGLGKSIYGAVRGSQILISKSTLDLGVRFIASTIYEEWLHKNENIEDCSRALQNLLFEKLFALVERLHVIDVNKQAVMA
jgi:hypothetical protein